MVKKDREEAERKWWFLSEVKTKVGGEKDNRQRLEDKATTHKYLFFFPHLRSSQKVIFLTI